MASCGTSFPFFCGTRIALHFEFGPLDKSLYPKTSIMERENALLLSSEENDELIRSTKKVIDNHHDITKRTGVENWVATNSINPKLSFKDKLVGEIPGAFAQAFDLRDKEETDKVPNSFKANMESDEIRELGEGLVAVKISQGLKQHIRAPWSKALIVKVYRRTVGYNFLHAKILSLWNSVGRIDCIDLEKDFFLVRFLVKEDHDSVLKNGPWFIGKNFLSIRPWEPNFKPTTAVVSSIAVWVRLNELPIEYYDSEALLIIDQVIGNVLRIDTHTATGTRGRYVKTSLKSRISITENSRRRNREKKEKQRERIVGKILQKLSH